MPVIATQQVKLGPFAEEIKHSESAFTVEKDCFSMLSKEVKDHLFSMKDRNTVVLYGLEAHVCIRRTALDLLLRGYSVYLVVDAISSIDKNDRNVGISSLQQAGATLITF